MKPISNKPLYLLMAPLLLLALLVALAAILQIRINLTPSLPKGLYRVVEGTPGKGDYVTFCLEGEYAALALERGYLRPGSCPSGVQPLLKRVAGLPGDTVDLAQIEIRSEDRSGLPLASALPPGTIPPDMALLMTDHQGSFDSRYFGLVPICALHKVQPVFLLTP